MGLSSPAFSTFFKNLVWAVQPWLDPLDQPSLLQGCQKAFGSSSAPMGTALWPHAAKHISSPQSTPLVDIGVEPTRSAPAQAILLLFKEVTPGLQVGLWGCPAQVRWGYPAQLPLSSYMGLSSPSGWGYQPNSFPRLHVLPSFVDVGPG